MRVSLSALTENYRTEQCAMGYCLTTKVLPDGPDAHSPGAH